MSKSFEANQLRALW